ncbi:antibiotic biosynthesis monooxygenase [Nitrosopumilus sp. b1]|uniref:antibiotic biosynthesis monooxygenase family protein n=1 Tax=Nitrosopumilus sp. b1 TaxID=2109907 RepID=UPI0015F357A6|nr:antibiotic biosynthesis monooxygenase [Nitrosopumilus sp. b1]KAF6242512.1 antibiotic biosynthesis monooxygenase [Nitrosopumilus sp. b1]
MFVGIIEFPKIKQGKNNDFLKWFEWSNSEFAKFDGFISRKLLQPMGNSQKYTIILELKDESTHREIHQSPVHQKMFSRLVELIDCIPNKSFFELASPLIQAK